MRKRKNKKKTNKLLIASLLIISFICGVYLEEISQSFGLNIENLNLESVSLDLTDKTKTSSEENQNIRIYFLDVGQADSILIQINNENMLIDAGNNNDGPLLVKYFQSLNIKKFKYLVGTHPHEDHIGGLDDIIDNFDIDKIYLPDVITTTKTFESVLNSIDEKNMTITIPKIGETFTLGNAIFKVIYTGTDQKDLNNTSIILKMTLGKTTYLFTGDATQETEKKIQNNDIKADILKVGHHGSKYSSTKDFLDKVSPKYAIISVGKNNIYNHPEDIALNRLKKTGAKILRTDELGTILLTSDGKNYHFTYLSTNVDGG